MANQNFRVKKGLEVGLGGTSLFADVSGVGIGSSAPRAELDVRGTGLFEEINVSAASTQDKALDVIGVSTFTGDVLIDGNAEVTGEFIFNDIVIDEFDFNVGVGSTLVVGLLTATDATIGFASITSLNVAGVSTFVGFATFQDNVSIGGTLNVGGDIVLDDLDAGNITVGGTVFTDGLDFNVGIGTTLSVNDLDVNSGVITSLTVTGVSSFVGFATFGGDVSVAGTIRVGGDIVLDDLESGSIITNEIQFNVGIGTTLVISGISSLQRITGFGSELQYLPPASVSTGDTIGVGSTPPQFRVTGEPIQPGDLWFDPVGLRQYTYYSGIGTIDGQWVDSNPPPVQPLLQFQGDLGTPGSIDQATEIFTFIGVDDQIRTQSGAGNTLTIGLTTSVAIGGSFTADGDLFIGGNFDMTGGIATITEADIDTAFISNLSVTGIAVSTINVVDGTIENLNFTSGIGSVLDVVDINVSGFASLNGAGIATIGGDVEFANINVTQTAGIGILTVYGPARVIGSITSQNDIYGQEAFFDKATVDQVIVDNIGVQTIGVGSVYATNVSAAGSVTTDYLQVGLGGAQIQGEAELVGLVTTREDLFVDKNFSAKGTLRASQKITGGTEIEAPIVRAPETLTFGTGAGTSLGLTGEFDFTVATGTTVTAQDINATGIVSSTGLLQFGVGAGGSITVRELNVLDGATIPGIPVTGGGASFSQLRVTGLSTFEDDVFVDGDLITSGNLGFSGVAGTSLSISGFATINQSSISTAFIGDLNFDAGIGTDLAVGTFSAGLATITNAGISSLAAGIVTVTDLTVYNQLLDSTDSNGAEGDILTTAPDGKLIWSTPTDAGLAEIFEPGNTFYVSINGTDDPTGGKSPEKAWRTIGYAISQIGNGTRNVLNITGGEYVEQFPLIIPKGLTIKGAGQRATIVRPDPSTETENGFYLDDRTTVEDLTIGGMYEPNSGPTYAFRFVDNIIAAVGAAITTRSPYIQRVTVLNIGSSTSTEDPYGFATPRGVYDTHKAAGSGALVDGSVVTADSLEAAMLFNDVTFFTPGAHGIDMINGARAEMVNSFIYFAEEGIRGESDLGTGFAGSGQTRLKVEGVTYSNSGTIRYLDTDETTELASGTISTADSTDPYIVLTNSGTGRFTTPERRVAKRVNFVGGAVLSTGQNNPFGAGTALDLTAPADAVNVDASSDFGFGTGDFTVEFWVHFDGNSNNNVVLFDMRDGSTGDTALSIKKNNSLNIEVQVAGVSVLTQVDGSLALNSWTHIAVRRASGTMELYVGGSLKDTDTVATDLGASKPLELGADYSANNGVDGYISDLRVEKGVAKPYSGEPTDFLKGDKDTSILLHLNGSAGVAAALDDTETFQVIELGGSTFTAAKFTVADYSQFGSDLRSVGCAVEYGTKGVVADGLGVTLRLITLNFNHIGAGGDISNDESKVNQADEVVQLNDGLVSYVSIDQKGDFRVGDTFYVDQETGEVSFTAETTSLTSLTSLTISDGGANSSVITPTSGRFGNLLLSGNVIESVTGGMTLRPSGAGELTIESDVSILGILTAASIELDAIRKGDTAISLDDGVGPTDGAIRFSIESSEVARFDGEGRLGISTDIPTAELDVAGHAKVESLEVTTGITTVGVLSATEVQSGLVTSQQGIFQNIVVVGIATLGAGGTEGGGQTIIEGNTVITGIVTIGENSTTISGIADNEFIRTGSEGTDFGILAGESGGNPSYVKAVNAYHTGIATVGVLTVTGDANVSGSLSIDGSINIEGGDIGVSTISAGDLNVSGLTTTNNLEVYGTSTVGFITGTDAYFSGIVTARTVSAFNIEFPGGSGIGSDNIVTEFLDVSGITTTANLNVTSGIATIGILSLTNGNVSAGLTVFNLDVQGTANISGSGIATEGGDLSFNSIDVAEGINVGGISTFEGQVEITAAGVGLTVTEDVFIGGDLTVEGKFDLTGDIVLDELEARNINVTGVGTIGTLGVTTDLTVGNDLTVTGLTSLTTANVDTVNAGALNVSGVSSVGFLTATDVYVGGGLTVAGNIDLAGDISLDDIDANTLDISDTARINVGIITSLGVLGVTTLGFTTTKDLAVGGAATVFGNLDVKGEISIDGTEIGGDSITVPFLTVTGVATINTGVATDLIVTGLSSLTDATVGGALTVSGITSALGLFEFTDGVGFALTTINFRSTNADLGVSSIANAKVQSLEVSGIGTFDQLVHVDTGSTAGTGVSVSNGGFFGGDLTVEGDLNVTGDLTYDEVTGRNLNITGIATINTGIVTTLSVSGLSSLTDVAVGGALTVTGTTNLGFVTATTAEIGVATVGFLTATDIFVGGGLTVGGSIDIEGGIEISGDISVDDITADVITANAGILTSLNVSGVTTLGVTSTTELLVGAGLTVVGETQLGIVTTSDAYVGGALTVSGDLVVDGKFDLTGDIKLDEIDARNLLVSGIATIGTLGVTTDLTVDAQTTLQELKVLGVSTLGFTTTADLFVGAAATVAGDLTVIGDLNFSGGGGGGTGIGSDFIDTQFLNVSGVATVSTGIVSTLSVLETASMVAVAATSLEVTGVTTVGFLTARDVVVGGAMTVYGDLDVTGDISYDEVSGRNLNISGIATIGTLGITTDLTVAGLSSLSDVTVGGALTVTGQTTVGFLTATDVWVSGAITATKIQAEEINFESGGGPGSGTGIGSDFVTTENLTVTELATINAGIVTSLEVTGVSTIGFLTAKEGFVGLLTVSDAIIEDLTVSGVSSVQSLTVNQQLSADGTGIGLTVANDAFVGGTLTVEGDLNVTGDISYDEVTGRNLEITGIATIGTLGVSSSLTVQDLTTTTDLTVNNLANITSLNVSGVATIGVLSATSGYVETLGFDSGTGNTLDLNDLTADDITVNNVASVGLLSATNVSVADSITANQGYFNAITFSGGTGIGSAFIDVPFFQAGIATISTGIVTSLEVTGVATVAFASMTDAAVSGILTANVIEAQEIIFEGGTGIGSAFIDVPFFQAGIATVGVGFATDLYVSGLLSTNQFSAGIATIQNLKVTGEAEINGIGIATIGSNAVFETLQVTGISTFQGEVEIGTVAISTVGIITASTGIVTYYGDGEFLRNIPGFSFQADGAPNPVTGTRPDGDALQVGDIYFDTNELRQFTLYDDGITRQWVDSNPPPTQPVFRFQGDTGAGVVNLEDEDFSIVGDSGLSVVAAGLTATIGFAGTVVMPDFVNILGDLRVEGELTAKEVDTFSDARLKDNITPMEDALDKVLQINGVDFTWKDSGESSAGVIAQEVEAVAPNLIRGSDPKTVNYNGLIGLLIESVKELKAENDELRARIENLEN